MLFGLVCKYCFVSWKWLVLDKNGSRKNKSPRGPCSVALVTCNWLPFQPQIPYPVKVGTFTVVPTYSHSSTVCSVSPYCHSNRRKEPFGFPLVRITASFDVILSCRFRCTVVDYLNTHPPQPLRVYYILSIANGRHRKWRRCVMAR